MAAREVCIMLRVYRRLDDHLMPTELEVAADYPCTAAAGGLLKRKGWL
jgi:hypothetical protein